jgi:Zn-dependent metalloprotease
VSFSQYYEGVPVFQTGISVYLTQYGEVWSVISKLAPIQAGTPATPVFTAQDALERARQLFQDSGATPDAAPELYILPLSHLVWRMNFSMPHFREMMVDAITGDIVINRKNIREPLIPLQ